jgi:hypothetical protein
MEQNKKIIMASMSEQMPAIFGSLEDRRKGTALPKVKDANTWASSDGYGESRIAYKIEEVIEEITSIEEGTLGQHYSLPRHAKMVDLFNSMAAASISFWTQLDGWVRQFNLELRHMSGSNAEEAWGLVMEMLFTIIKDLGTAKRPGSVAESELEPTNRCALVLWGCLQEHRMMKSIMDMGFQRHPCVMPCMTSYLFSRRAPTSKVDALEKVVKELQAECRALKSTSDTLWDTVKKLEHKK